jgi:N-methylhydantoinase B
VYGVVVIDDPEGRVTGADPDATRDLRRELRAARLGVPADRVADVREVSGPDTEPAGLAPGERWLPLTDRLRVIVDVGGSWRVQTVDGVRLCTGSTHWRNGARPYAVELPDRVGGTLHEDLQVTGWLCPESGALLAVDIHLADEEPFHDLDLDLADGGIAAALARPATGGAL